MVFELSNEGDQVPVKLLFEVVGNGLKVPPLHIGEIAVNIGVNLALTTILIDVAVAHNPWVGVNVYVVVFELSKAGDQVPVILLFEVVGKAFSVAPEHIALTCVNVGVTIGFTVIDNVAVDAHNPCVGVKV